MYNFIDSVAKATNDRPAGKTEAPKEKGATTHRRFANEYYYKQRAKSAHSQRTTERFQLPPRPHSVGAIRHEDEAAEESGEEHGTEYAPCHPHHTEGKCEFCDYMRVKKLLEDLNRWDFFHLFVHYSPCSCTLFPNHVIGVCLPSQSAAEKQSTKKAHIPLRTS